MNNIIVFVLGILLLLLICMTFTRPSEAGFIGGTIEPYETTEYMTNVLKNINPILYKKILGDWKTKDDDFIKFAENKVTLSYIDLGGFPEDIKSSGVNDLFKLYIEGIYNKLTDIPKGSLEPTFEIKFNEYMLVPDSLMNKFNNLYPSNLYKDPTPEILIEICDINKPYKIQISRLILLFSIIYQQYSNVPYFPNYPNLQALFMNPNVQDNFLFFIEYILLKKDLSSMTNQQLAYIETLSRILLGFDLEYDITSDLPAPGTDNPLSMLGEYIRDARDVMAHGDKKYLVKNPYKNNLRKLLKRGDCMSKMLRKSNIDDNNLATFCCVKNRIQNNLRDA